MPRVSAQGEEHKRLHLQERVNTDSNGQSFTQTEQKPAQSMRQPTSAVGVSQVGPASLPWRKVGPQVYPLPCYKRGCLPPPHTLLASSRNGREMK